MFLPIADKFHPIKGLVMSDCFHLSLNLNPPHFVQVAQEGVLAKKDYRGNQSELRHEVLVKTTTCMLFKLPQLIGKQTVINLVSNIEGSFDNRY